MQKSPLPTRSREARLPRFACWATALMAALLTTSCYVTEQGLRYLSLLSRAVPVSRALADPLTDPALRALIESARAAGDFAVGSLGLKRTKNFTSIVELKGDRLATVVQACAELSFDRWLWSYPVVGKLPYRGYFDPEEARAEAARLRALGLDVIVRPVDAFSSLGWLADPLFSPMASYDEAEVSELVIHEMTHATVFLKGNGSGAEQFNEELATFVGREGALLWLASAGGPDSPELALAVVRGGDARSFAEWLRGTAAELERVYDSGLSDGEKRERKSRIVADRAAAFAASYDAIFKTDRYGNFPMGGLNNAYLDLYRLYEGEDSLYDDYYREVCGSDMRRFLEKVSRIASTTGRRGDPKAAMRSELRAAAE
jgi:predicted aminopeptidase